MQDTTNAMAQHVNMSLIGSHTKTQQALAQFGSEITIDHLLHWSGYSQALEANNFVPAFNVRKNRDFIDSKTVLLERWVVSRAELAICTLANQFPARGSSA